MRGMRTFLKIFHSLIASQEDFHDTDSSHSMWMAVDGKNEFCTCCESTCGMRKIRALSVSATGNACQQERAQYFISHA